MAVSDEFHVFVIEQLKPAGRVTERHMFGTMAYWQVPADVLEDADELAIWAREAMAVALLAKSKR